MLGVPRERGNQLPVYRVVVFASFATLTCVSNRRMHPRLCLRLEVFRFRSVLDQLFSTPSEDRTAEGMVSHVQ